MGTFIWLSPNPPSPSVTYEEFPFSLVYEISGERIEVKDTLVIEYEGVNYNEGLGKYNTWNTYYKSSQVSDEDLILFDDFIEGIGGVSITFDLGSCEYYMGLPETENMYKTGRIKPGDIVYQAYREYNRAILDDELYERFNIKIIEKSISPPIVSE